MNNVGLPLPKADGSSSGLLEHDEMMISLNRRTAAPEIEQLMIQPCEAFHGGEKRAF
jgi:hypothetical protein